VKAVKNSAPTGTITNQPQMMVQTTSQMVAGVMRELRRAEKLGLGATLMVGDIAVTARTPWS
jgi:hypothetical protein